MKIWAVVPVKPGTASKSRLAGVLSADQRARLAESLLEHTLGVLADWPALAGVLLVTAGAEMRQIGLRYGTEVLCEPDLPGLNHSLERACRDVAARGAEAILVVPADLPLLSRESLNEVIAAAVTPPLVVIAPDQLGNGTNILMLAPISVIPFRFGPGSLAKHTLAAQEAGAALVRVDSPALSFDVDRPEDLDRLEALGIFR